MRFKFLIIFLFTVSCSVQLNSNLNKFTYSSSGFAYVYSDDDYSKKIVSKKFDNDKLLVGHNILNPGVLVKVSNPENKKSITLKIKRKTKYPDFYQVLITRPVFDKLDLNSDTPFVEIQEIKKNKSFIAGKTKTHFEERKVSNKAPITNVKIDNISKNKSLKKVSNKKFTIKIAEFYSYESAKKLKDKLNNEIFASNYKKVLIKKKKRNSFELVLGPYKAVNLLKNDYIALKDYGFEDLEIKSNE